MHCLHCTEGGVVEEYSSLTISKEKEKKSSKKERYSKGIEAAVTIIVGFFVQNEEFSDGKINAVLASMLCGEIVTAKSLKGKKALMKVTQIDKDFVRTAIDTCKKTKELGGEPGEIACAAASVLACRNVRKHRNYKLNESVIDNMPEHIAREVMMKREEKDFNTSNNEQTNEINSKNNYATHVAPIVGFCLFDDPSEVSLEYSVNSITSLDSGLRETSIIAWDANFIDYMSYGFAEAINICGTKLLCVSEEVKNDIRENIDLFR